MSDTYNWPAAWTLDDCSLMLSPLVTSFESANRAWQGLDQLGERWMMTGRLSMAKMVDGGAREAFFNRLRGVNVIAAWWFARPAPIGTQRGSSLVLSANVAQGASVLPISGGTNGATLLAGDMIGCGGQLFQVADDATFSSGAASINTVNRSRAFIASTTAIVWDKPTTLWRLASPVYASYRSVFAQPIDIELIETWIA
jgi:hypothetical protein